MLIHNAISNRDAGKVKELLQAGADPNAKDDLGNSPLITAAQYENAEVAREVAKSLAILPQAPESPEGLTVEGLVWHGR